jgi:glutathione S-transferase
MSSSKPVLYVFAISHYCEKARWALDYLDVDYELRHVAPGEHMEIAKALGAPRSSVPYLSLDERVIQGSADIVSWVESVSPSGKSLTPDAAACEKIEKRIDDAAGVHVRRFYYSEALVDHPSMIRPIFTRDLPLAKKLMISLGWGKIRKRMMTRMDLGTRQGKESEIVVSDELSWVDELLADGRSYLVGDEFSRADIAVASILSPLVLPAEHPVYCRLQHPPKLADALTRWEQRPSFKWVRDIYAKHR